MTPSNPPNDPNFNPESGVFIEALYDQYRADPDSVPSDWQAYFQAVDAEPVPHVDRAQVEQELIRQARCSNRFQRNGETGSRKMGLADTNNQIDGEYKAKQSAVYRLIYNYRLMGHIRANTDPILIGKQSSDTTDLDAESEGLTAADMDTEFDTGTLPVSNTLTLREIIEFLQETYTQSVGCEFMHNTDPKQKSWLMSRIENNRCKPFLSDEHRKDLLRYLVAAEGLERYLHTRFSGQKRFSLEGGDTLIPLMQELIQNAGSTDYKEVVIGMAHRGRLNMLINVMGKDPDELFSEFEGHIEELGDKMTGDVKYHQGFSSDMETPGGQLHLALSFNPSHLEIINPVVQGSARARQDRRSDDFRRLVLPVIIHGDAAISGQGVVYEALQFSETRGFTTGGTIHVVINNQVGFTTSDPLDSRSSLYCTDVGKTVQAPIFHVNGDDPEAALFAIQTALEFRTHFDKDVFIDLVCYRRHGHNEGDEPSVTQPVMYDRIRKHKTVADQYAERLIEKGIISNDDYRLMKKQYREALDRGDQVAPNILPEKDFSYLAKWEPYLRGSLRQSVKTGYGNVKDLKRIGHRCTKLPADFVPHKAVEKIFTDRRAMADGETPLDWGFAETMAYATLIEEGFNVRISGQDVGRGTFFHRHATVHDQKTGRTYTPLQHLFEDQPRVTVIDSILSEEAVLGFEYGYSTTDPQTLTIWEAQYGDFANGAQVVIDQFITSCFQKWHLFNGLVMLLPHGWEGQGPEHSSARLERYLQLCAQENMQVVAPTTASQMFHLLRRQMKRKMRIPLIVMSPKSMLRRKESFSKLGELARSHFYNLIPEHENLDPNEVDRIVVCSGKIYYDLLTRRTEAEIKNVAMIRIEQLYPFPIEELKKEIEKYPQAQDVIWTQEEPRNQGPWHQIRHNMVAATKDDFHKISFAGRIPCAAPAGGNPSRHRERERLLIDEALGLLKQPGEPESKKNGKAKSKQ